MAGSYRIGVETLPSWYTFSSAWNGALDATGAKLYPDAQNIIDPSTGTSECFDVVEGEAKAVMDFGLRLNIPDANPSPVSGSPTTKPTVAGTQGSVGNATSAPSAAGIVVRTPAPTVNETVAPSFAGTTLPPAASMPTMPPVVGGNGTEVIPSGDNATDVTGVVNTTQVGSGENATGLGDTSEAPSMVPSAIPSSIPSLAPSPSSSNATVTLAPTISSSSNVTTAANETLDENVTSTGNESSAENTTSAPTAAGTTPPAIPERIGDLIGPVTDKGLQITLTGINFLEAEADWANYTAEYIQSYFSTGFGVWDVQVELVVTNQGLRRLKEGRRDQEQHVVVTYDQTSTYKTDDGSTSYYVITEPFASSLDQARYTLFLADNDKYYEDVTSASTVTVPGAQENSNKADKVTAPAPAPETQPNNLPLIIGVSIGLGVVLLVGGMFLMYKGRERGDEYYDDPTSVGGGGGMLGTDLEAGSRASRGSKRSATGSRQGSNLRDE